MTTSVSLKLCASTFNHKKENSLKIIGELGEIKIADPFWQPTSMTLKLDKKTEFFEPMLANGYEYEAIEAMQCLRKKKIESQLVSHENTLDVMQTLDQIRLQWGLKYPTE